MSAVIDIAPYLSSKNVQRGNDCSRVRDKKTTVFGARATDTVLTTASMNE